MRAEDQFVRLIEQHKKLIFKIANAYSRSSDDLQDLVQEITLQLWKAYPKYDPSFAISTWIYRIALNVSISYYRKEKTRKKRFSRYQSEADLVIWEDQTIDERLQQLYRLIEGLKPLEKAIIILYLDGQSNGSIAEIMGMSVTNVSTRLNRIKNKLATAAVALKS